MINNKGGIKITAGADHPAKYIPGTAIPVADNFIIRKYSLLKVRVPIQQKNNKQYLIKGFLHSLELLQVFEYNYPASAVKLI